MDKKAKTLKMYRLKCRVCLNLMEAGWIEVYGKPLNKNRRTAIRSTIYQPSLYVQSMMHPFMDAFPSSNSDLRHLANIPPTLILKQAHQNPIYLQFLEYFAWCGEIAIDLTEAGCNFETIDRNVAESVIEECQNNPELLKFAESLYNHRNDHNSGQTEGTASVLYEKDDFLQMFWQSISEALLLPENRANFPLTNHALKILGIPSDDDAIPMADIAGPILSLLIELGTEGAKSPRIHELANYYIFHRFNADYMRTKGRHNVKVVENDKETTKKQRYDHIPLSKLEEEDPSEAQLAMTPSLTLEQERKTSLVRRIRDLAQLDPKDREAVNAYMEIYTPYQDSEITRDKCDALLTERGLTQKTMDNRLRYLARKYREIEALRPDVRDSFD